MDGDAILQEAKRAKLKEHVIPQTHGPCASVIECCGLHQGAEISLIILRFYGPSLSFAINFKDNSILRKTKQSKKPQRLKHQNSPCRSLAMRGLLSSHLPDFSM